MKGDDPVYAKRLAIMILATTLALCGASAIPAQEEDLDSDGFSDFSDIDEIIGEGSGSGQDTAVPSEEPRGLDIGGRFRFNIRYSAGKGPLKSSPITTYPEVKLDFLYQNRNSDLFASLQFTHDAPFNSPDNLIDEAYLRLYYERFDLEMGFQKVIWGPGDEAHVIDVLTPMDYTDFVNQDYVDRKLAELMIKLNWKLPGGSLLETVYQPVFTPDTFPLEGPWVPYDLKRLLEGGLDPSTDVIYPNTDTLKYGQLAARWSKAPGRLDLGVLYYCGYFREPSIDNEKLLLEGKAHLSYDRVDFLGGDLGAVLWGFNTWLELGYYLTGDWSGDDPLVHNHRLVMLLGFDRNLGVSNLNVELQLRGNYTMHSGRILPGDTEYNAKGRYTDDILILALRDSYIRERIRPVISVAYTLEERDYIIWPEVDFTLRDDATLTFMYLAYGGDPETYFGQFADNDFFEIRFEYRF
jgi:hypothetical protein